jgi:hypothetical protein
VNPMSKSRIWSRVFFVVALLGVSLGAVAAPTEPADEGLFSEVASADGSGAKDDPAVVRSRLVTVDLAQLDAPGGASIADRLVLNFFPDAVYTAVLDRVETSSLGAFSWVGNLEGVELSQVILAVKDGVMIGNAVAPGMFYQVRYAGDGVHAIREADQAAFPPELPPIPVDLPAGDVAQPNSAADDGSTIDVLVIYTDDARAQVGGTAAMEAMIATAETETNAGYANSGITQRVNVVHTAEVSYDESGFDWNTTLSRFRAHGDGYFDIVTQPTTGLRDTYLADESVLIVRDTAYCGLAYMMVSVSPSFEYSAFALVSYNCATGYYSFGHEMGHNMGAHHDWYVEASTSPYPYNHGFVNYPDRWRTIMAYNTRCGGDYCDRLNYWSNPDVSYYGDPMGVVTTGPTNCVEGSLSPDPSTCAADNRTVLNNTAYTVANFRAPPNTPGTPSPADGAVGQSVDVGLGWTGGDPDPTDAVAYTVYLEAYDATPDNIACGGITSTTCDPGALIRGAHYYWRVVATDSHGASASGPVWDFYVNRLPDTPSNPLPPDGATGESQDTDLGWTGGDPDAGDTVTYTVYLDTSTSPGSVVCEGTATTCDPPSSLLPSTPYYWQVVATDDHGEAAAGPVWDFDTGTATGPTVRGYVRDVSLAALAGVTVTFSGPFTTTTGSDGYYAQTGFGGGTVTVTVEVDGYTFSPWLDQVVVGGDVTHHVTGYPLTHTALLFSDGFESGSLGSAWVVETDYEGRVRVATEYPAAGSYGLLLDDDTDGGFTSHASSILALDLSGETEVKLGFWWREFDDENHPDDGVFISDDDGVTWYPVYSFNDGPATFIRATIDLDEEANAAGMSLNDHFLVKFQFYDNWPVGGTVMDGYAIDDVIVYSDRYNVYLPLVLRGWP